DRRATTRLRLAQVLIDQGHYYEAKLVIEQGLALRETNTVKFQVLLSQCHLALKHYDMALQASEMALAEGNKEIEAHTVRAAALYELKRYDDAVKAADEALKLSPTQLQAIRIKAQALISGRHDEDLTQAIRLLHVYIREQPADSERRR